MACGGVVGFGWWLSWVLGLYTVERERERERERGGGKEERHKLDRKDYFLGYIFY